MSERRDDKKRVFKIFFLYESNFIGSTERGVQLSRLQKSDRSSVSISIEISESSSSSSSVSKRSRSGSKEKSVPKQMERYKAKNHENQVLLLENISSEVSKYQLEMILNEAAVETQVSPHLNISMMQAFNTAYVKYQSIDCARRVLQFLRGKIEIGEHCITVDYYDEIVPDHRRKKDGSMSQIQGGLKQVELKNSLMNQPPATSYDWICDKCQYENFAKRQKCNKCLNPRNSNCKILSVLVTPPNISNQIQKGIEPTELNFNTSLMIRGKSIVNATESEILDVFQQLASVKDIRLVQNKPAGGTKDFAFVEFFTLEDTDNVFRRVTNGEVKIRGEPISIQYSKSSKNQRFFEEHLAQHHFNQQQKAAASLSGVGDLPSNYDSYYHNRQNTYYNDNNNAPWYQQQQYYNWYQNNQGYQYPQYGFQQYQQPQTTYPIQQQMSQPTLTSYPIQQQITTTIEQQTQQLPPKVNNPKPQPQKIESIEKLQQKQQEKPKQTIEIMFEGNSIQDSQQKPQKQNKLRTKEDFQILNEKEETEYPEEPVTQVQQKEVDARKKVEQELKQWQKQQSNKVSQSKSVQIAPPSPSNTKKIPDQQIKNESFLKEFLKYFQEAKQNQVEREKPVLILCPLCKKKFQSEELQTIHQLYSELHHLKVKQLAKAVI